MFLSFTCLANHSIGPIKAFLGRMSELPSIEDNFKELDTKLLQLEEEIQKNINKLNFLPESKKIQVRTNFQLTKDHQRFQTKFS
jgi:hypothetical protein